jgi:putative copper export protein
MDPWWEQLRPVGVTVFSVLVIVHALGATVWTGGHLVLDLGVLPKALKLRRADLIREYEQTFEPLGLTALAIQVITGLWMGWIYLPRFQGLITAQSPIAALISAKLVLLAATLVLAVHARLRLIPHLTDENLSRLAWHIRAITALAIAFVVVGAGVRLGGFS